MTKPIQIDAEGTEDTMSGRMDSMGSFKGPVEPDADSRADSHAHQRESTHTADDTGEQRTNSERQPQAGTQLAGDVLPASTSGAPAGSEPHTRERVDILAVAKRLQREGHWNEELKLELFKQAKKLSDDKDERQQWVYSELDRMYPPVQSSVQKVPIHIGNSDVSPCAATKPISESEDSGSIQGLSDLPKGWPELPANASLSSEVGWVQANRLRIVEERPGGATRVRLERALSPAPSWAALGWLETSIRSYAKYVDVASKATASADDEGAVMKRERKSIDEVRALLEEMKVAEGSCTRCGRPH